MARRRELLAARDAAAASPRRVSDRTRQRVRSEARERMDEAKERISEADAAAIMVSQAGNRKAGCNTAKLKWEDGGYHCINASESADCPLLPLCSDGRVRRRHLLQLQFEPSKPSDAMRTRRSRP